MSKIDIKVYIPPYNKQNFYSLMGKYFAERVYRRKLPYLINTSSTIWFLLMNKERIIGFSSIVLLLLNGFLLLLKQTHIED